MPKPTDQLNAGWKDAVEEAKNNRKVQDWLVANAQRLATEHHPWIEWVAIVKQELGVDQTEYRIQINARAMDVEKTNKGRTYSPRNTKNDAADELAKLRREMAKMKQTLERLTIQKTTDLFSTTNSYGVVGEPIPMKKGPTNA
jgi:hypothetical protein